MILKEISQWENYVAIILFDNKKVAVVLQKIIFFQKYIFTLWVLLSLVFMIYKGEFISSCRICHFGIFCWNNYSNYCDLSLFSSPIVLWRYCKQSNEKRIIYYFYYSLYCRLCSCLLHWFYADIQVR